MSRLVIPPQSVEAEVGVLGSVLIDPEAMTLIADMLPAEDFYRDAHRTIYEAMLTLYRRQSPADLVTLSNELQRGNTLEAVGGTATLVGLINEVPTSGNVVFYAQIVTQKALYRRLIHAAGEIAAMAYAEEVDALERAEQAVFALARRTHQADAVPVSVVIEDCMDHLSAAQQEHGSIVGVPTGFRPLDTALGGLQRSDLLVLAARPGMGKTAFALSIAANAAYEHRHRVAIFTLEMSKEQLGQRLIAMRSQIDQQRLRMGWVHDEEWERIVSTMGTLAEGPIWIDDTGGLSLNALRSRARRLQAQQGIELLIVDYLQLMHASQDGKRFPSREQEIAEISRGLKSLARELNIPVLALAQLSRAVEGRQSKVPQLSDLRESGSIENDADVVLFIYREGMYDPENLEAQHVADILIAKHRNGPVGAVRLGFEASQTRFYPIDYAPDEEGG
ncbi:MAG TPA: replicative DNA helicase [Ktedonobacteraceae bacterium]|nr:replicative DNA helicase [Ktedonobacteraceae bacterium]